MEDAHLAPGAAPPQPVAARWRSALPLTALVLVIVFSACSGPGRPEGGARATGTPQPNSNPHRAESAADICSQFTRLALSADATTDQGPADARRRAGEVYGTSDLPGRLSGQGRDQTWTLLSQHHARVTVATSPVEDDPPPADQAVTGAAVSATRLARGTDGWQLALPDVVAYCSLQHEDEGGWRVLDVSFSDTTSRSVPR